MGDLMKEMTSKFDKLEKFQGNEFRQWQENMHFSVDSSKVGSCCEHISPETQEDEMLEQTKHIFKCENNDCIYRCHVMNDMWWDVMSTKQITPFVFK